MIDKTILHYKIIEKLGEGGMGEVYKAQDTKLDRVVALKFLPSQLTTSEDDKARFIQEAKSASAINNPNVCTIYSIEEYNGQLFISMEFIEGKTLKEKKDSLSEKQILEIGIQVAEGLAAAHEKGIVHRDIKSDNIMLTPKGQVKIMDFGLAKVKGGTKLTAVGFTLGTIAYMSPEQTRGEKVDHRTDVWSFGVVLYEMLTGKMPFRGDYDQAIIYSILNEESEPLTNYQSEENAALAKIIDKTLRKNPEERYQSMKEILSELKKIEKFYSSLSGESSTINRNKVLNKKERQTSNQKLISSNKKIKLIISVSGIFILTLIVLGYFLWFNKVNVTYNSTEFGKSIAVLPFENLSSDKNNAYFADGMQDIILTKLADIGDLKVISRTSTEKYKSHPEDLKTISEQLGVATILEGSVQKSGNQVLINVQLIDAHTDNHIWANSYMRTINNIFGVEGEVAQKVADALNAKLTKRQTTKINSILTKNQAAYDAYLRGEYYYAKVPAGNWKILTKVVQSYKRAVENDPSFAMAWAKLAFCQSLLMYVSIDRSGSTAQNALANAKHALELDPNLSYGHFALGYVYRMDFAEYNKALNEFEIAWKGLPNNSDVLSAIAYLKIFHGELQAASENLRQAILLNPNDPNLEIGLGFILNLMRQYESARLVYNRILTIAPDDPEVYVYLAQTEILKEGNVDSAMTLLDEAPVEIQSSSDILNERAELLILKRDYTKARKIAKSLQPGGRSVTKLQILRLRAEVCRLAGDYKCAKENYRKALDEANAFSNDLVTEKTFWILQGKAIIQAGLGQKSEALKTLDKRLNLAKEKEVSFFDPMIELARARVKLLIGDNTGAITALDQELSSPIGSLISVNLVRLDPFWDPLRKEPAFQIMLNKYSGKN